MTPLTHRPNLMPVIAAGLLIACSGGRGGALDTSPRAETVTESRAAEVFEGPVAQAQCGPGAQPETDIQGRVSIEDRTGGRSQEGYWCNLELVGQHQGQGASWQVAWYEDCAYYGTAFSGQAGVQVIDASDPTNPQQVGALRSPAMLDPWESLKVNETRGLLGADTAWNGFGPAFFDVYDLNGDCAQPDLLASTPSAVPIGHEGEWAPDGKTYYVGVAHSAIDVTDPNQPRLIPQADAVGSLHGLSLNEAGTRMYAVSISTAGLPEPACNGLVIYDTSQIQARVPLPAMPELGRVCWDDGALAQHTIPVFYDGIPYVIFVDEGGLGASRIIDISDETLPKVVSKMKLEIHMPDRQAERDADLANNGSFGYEAHYCGVDRKINPTALACGYFQSGIRVFDIRNPHEPREIAYYNPPAQIGNHAELTSSEHASGAARFITAENDLSTDWCSAQVRFVRERGEIWTTCQDNGFLVLRFTNGTWPFD